MSAYEAMAASLDRRQSPAAQPYGLSIFEDPRVGGNGSGFAGGAGGGVTKVGGGGSGAPRGRPKRKTGASTSKASKPASSYSKAAAAKLYAASAGGAAGGGGGGGGGFSSSRRLLSSSSSSSSGHSVDQLANRTEGDPTVYHHCVTANTGKGFVGAYSEDDRRHRIERFFEKRLRRVWTKKVKYDVRKNFADSRVRVKGRFVKKEDEENMRELGSLV